MSIHVLVVRIQKSTSSLAAAYNARCLQMMRLSFDTNVFNFLRLNAKTIETRTLDANDEGLPQEKTKLMKLV